MYLFNFVGELAYDILKTDNFGVFTSIFIIKWPTIRMGYIKQLVRI